MESNVRAHLIISGRVQGVFFRVETQRAVEQIGGVCGWVRNRPEGTVEAVFEGSPESVEKAVSWCRKGAPMSKVEDVQMQWEEYTGDYDCFSITG